MADEDSKIIIDEDWKAQVQREKEEAKSAGQEEETAKPEAPPAAPEQAGFDTLVSMLAAQAMMALGLIAQEGAKEVMVNVNEAKFLIDLLMAVRDKTRNNLTSEEEGHLTEVLADLQRAFAMRSQQLHEAALRNSGIDPNKKAE